MPLSRSPLVIPIWKRIKHVDSFNPIMPCALAISGDKVINNPTLYQIGIPINIQAKYFSALLRDENNSNSDPLLLDVSLLSLNMEGSNEFSRSTSKMPPAIP